MATQKRPKVSRPSADRVVRLELDERNGQLTLAWNEKDGGEVALILSKQETKWLRELLGSSDDESWYEREIDERGGM